MQVNSKLKMLAVSVFLTGILFIQEEVLSFIPNFQFTFLLIAVYGATIGMYYGTLIVITHVILDNLFMGSFTLWIMIPQAIGLFIALLFGYLFRNKNEYIEAIFSSIAALIYCYLYIPFNIVFFNVKFIPYLIADIPFEIILVITSFITVMLLFKPLVKIINKLLKETLHQDVINNISYEKEQDSLK